MSGEARPDSPSRRALTLRFRLDHLGRDRLLSTALAPGREVPDWLIDELRSIEANLDAMEQGLRVAGLTLADLQTAGVLAVPAKEAFIAGRRLGLALADGLTYPRMADDFQLVRRLGAGCDRLGSLLVYVVQMAVLLEGMAAHYRTLLPAGWARSANPMADALAVVRRSCKDAWDALVMDGPRRAEWQDQMESWYPIKSIDRDVRLDAGKAWAEQIVRLKEIPQPGPETIEQLDRRLWDQWAARAEDYFTGKPARHLEWDDYAMAALKRSPSALLFDGYGALDRLDWSVLALQGAGAPEAPAWATIAGLRGLGFDGGLLKTLAAKLGTDDSLPKTSQDASFWSVRLAAGAAPAPQGKVAIVTNPAQALSADGEVPTLFVSDSEVEYHAAALEWLENHAVFRLDEISKPDIILP